MSSDPHTPAYEHVPYLPLWSCQPQGSERVTISTRADMETHLVLRALRDPAFREDLVGEPVATLRREYGLLIPDDVRLQVLTETATEAYLVLPHNPFAGVSEDQLKLDTGFPLEHLATLVTQSRRDTLLGDGRTAALVAHAWRDEAFRAAFLSDPKSAIEREIGFEFPDGHQFTAMEEGPHDIFVVLPHAEEENAPWALDARAWEEANLGASYVLMVAVGGSEREHCRGSTCYRFGETDGECYETCVDRPFPFSFIYYGD